MEEFNVTAQIPPTDPNRFANAFADRVKRHRSDRALLATFATVGIMLALAALVIAILTFAEHLAFAQTAAAPATAADQPTDWLGSAYNAIFAGGAGAWKIVAGAGLSLVVYAVRTYSVTPIPLLNWRLPLPAWFTGRRGGAVLVLALAFLGGIGHALLAGASLNLDMLKSALLLAATAIGGYEGIRALFGPQTAPTPTAAPPKAK